MFTIRNKNEKFGDAIEFSGKTLEEAVQNMQTALRACGKDFEAAVVTNADYEVVSRPGTADEVGMALGADGWLTGGDGRFYKP
jgi:hypothetical protein